MLSTNHSAGASAAVLARFRGGTSGGEWLCDWAGCGGGSGSGGLATEMAIGLEAYPAYLPATLAATCLGGATTAKEMFEDTAGVNWLARAQVVGGGSW